MKVDERFLKYVSFDTTSHEESETCPSTPNQLVLGKYLAEELTSVGASGVVQDEFGYVYGWLPATPGCEAEAAIGLIAHMDTSDAVSGADIKPRYVKYEGGDIVLSDTETISPAKFPFLETLVGKTLIVTDGTTLLGGDDKAGVAEIMQTVEYLAAHPEVKHGKICVAFTPDEEIGRGTEHFDVKGFGADFAYTLDGGTLGEVEYECFNAAAAKITVNGVSIHPGGAKNKMKNAVLIACELIGMLPAAESPSHTEGYEGFYHVGGISGNETETRLGVIIRDHDREKFEARKVFVTNLVNYLNSVYGEGTVELELKDTYYNMKEIVLRYPEVLKRANDAFLKAGITPTASPIRGGTDGASLSFMGLPCPNLSTGDGNCHGVHEFVCVDSMEKMLEVLLNLLTVA